MSSLIMKNSHRIEKMSSLMMKNLHRTDTDV